jgi:nucleoid-associated protein YgaU
VTNAVALTSSAHPAALGAPAPAGGGAQRPQLQRAVLKLYEPVPKPWGAAPGAERGSIPFQFNPTEVHISKSATWGRDAAKADAAGPVEFTGSGECHLDLEMFFDASGTHDGSVVAAVEQLLRCCLPTESSADRKRPSPVLVVFQWGRITSFPAFVTNVDARYTLFAPDGTPIRATCTVSLEEMPTQSEKTNPTSGAPAVRKVHTVVAGDTLASVAYAEYGDPALWRPLAAYNEIDDPMRPPRGARLLLPAFDELVPTGR